MNLDKWLDRFFIPPPPPDFHLPLPARLIPGVRSSITDALKLAYYAGLKDALPWGFIAGFLAALVLGCLMLLVAHKFLGFAIQRPPQWDDQ